MSDSENTVEKKSRPKIERREVVDGKPVRKGRPPKAAIAAKKKGGRGALGRPVGDSGRIQELKARLLATTGDKVINKIVEIAMTDNHPVQGAALKMCLDRILPLSYFEKAKDSGSMPQISINITSLGETKVEQAEIVDSVEITDVQYNDE
jgi:hypothetical protein